MTKNEITWELLNFSKTNLNIFIELEKLNKPERFRAIHNFFTQMPEDRNKKFQDAKFIYRGLNTNFSVMSDITLALNMAFNWNETSEGFEYWRKIAEKYNETQ